MTSLYPLIPSGSYEARVKDIQTHLRHVREGLKAVEDRRSHVLSLKQDLQAEILTDIARKEDEAIARLQDEFNQDRRRAEAAFEPLDDDIQASDELIAKFRDLVDRVQTVCTPRRSTALVDRHSEIVSSISDLSFSVSEYLRRPLDLDAFESEISCEDRLVLGDLEVRESPASSDFVRVYLQISDSCSTPHFNVRLLCQDVTVADLLDAVAARLNRPASLAVYIKTGPASDVFFPLHRRALLLDELRDFDLQEDLPGWPRLFVRSSNCRSLSDTHSRRDA